MIVSRTEKIIMVARNKATTLFQFGILILNPLLKFF